MRDSIFDPSNNILATSIRLVEGAGHMVRLHFEFEFLLRLRRVSSTLQIPQQNPDGLANAICEALVQISPRRKDVLSKL
jgi:hypothetical protein